MDMLLKPFTFERYKNERHAINENGIPYNWMGPFTSIKDRTNPDGTYKESSTPISKADYESYLHDKTYYKAKQDYDKNPTPENRNQQLQKVWTADDKFVNEMSKIKNERMAPLAGSLISTKKYLEKDFQALPTTIFEGFGAESNDPAFRLRALVNENYKKEKKQKGGLIPLIPIAATALGMLSGKNLQDIYSVIKKKVTGSGIKMNHKNNNDKKEFILDIIKQIKT